MKRKLAVLGLLGFAALFGCSQIDDGKVSASLPSGFEITTKDEIGDYSDQYVIKHTITGCYYLFAEHWDANSITQMFVEKNGVSVPYCEK